MQNRVATTPTNTSYHLRETTTNLPAGRSLESLVGNTPLLDLSQLIENASRDVRLYAKAEWLNPGGSVKDRPALNIIREAEKRGDLREGITLLDSTSGNMGIAYAMFGAARGHRVKLVIPANASRERMQILRAYGVELVISDPAEGSEGARVVVKEIAAADPHRYFYANQYDNPDNWQAHYKTTANEIWQQTTGQVTHFIAGLGTTGTLTGTGRRLRELNPDIRLLAMQPDSPFHGLEGLKHIPSAVKPGIYDESVHDEIVPVRTEDAHAMCRRLAREMGYLVGISSGAAVSAALQIAQSLEDGVVVTVLPDDASKYLSDAFWGEED